MSASKAHGPVMYQHLCVLRGKVFVFFFFFVSLPLSLSLPLGLTHPLILYALLSLRMPLIVLRHCAYLSDLV